MIALTDSQIKTLRALQAAPGGELPASKVAARKSLTALECVAQTEVETASGSEVWCSITPKGQKALYQWLQARNAFRK